MLLLCQHFALSFCLPIICTNSCAIAIFISTTSYYVAIDWMILLQVASTYINVIFYLYHLVILQMKLSRSSKKVTQVTQISRVIQPSSTFQLCVYMVHTYVALCVQCIFLVIWYNHLLNIWEYMHADLCKVVNLEW